VAGSETAFCVRFTSVPPEIEALLRRHREPVRLALVS